MNENTKGLSSDSAKEKLLQFGLNKIPSANKGFLKKIAAWVLSPISLMLLASSILSYILGKLFDFYFISALYLINFAITQWEEHKANTAIASLQKLFTTQVLVNRDGQWQKLNTEFIVPDDIITLHAGNIVPADAIIITTSDATIDQSSLTGESEPIQAKQKTKIFSGTTIQTGELTAKVTATGGSTKFANTLALAEKVKRSSAMEQDILSISKLLGGISIFCVLLLTLILGFRAVSPSEIIITDLSIIIAGVPIALPTVMSLIISLGAGALAKKKVVIRRLSSLEDLANVNLLLSDKTGTLTHHHIEAGKVIPIDQYTEKDVMSLAILSTQENDTNPISVAIQEKAASFKIPYTKPDKIILGDSERKRTTAFGKWGDKDVIVSAGAPQIILKLSNTSLEKTALINQIIDDAGKRGYRTILIAYAENQLEEKDLIVVGVVLLGDKIREDAKTTIASLKDQGIITKMVTGDHLAIASEVGRTLGLEGPAVNRSKILENIKNPHILEQYGVFAEVYPEDKLALVQAMKQNYTVAVTGDGVNDIPAVNAANVGISVKNGVDALRMSADIVLLEDGIAVIKTALDEARKIFARLFFYSVYRISESFRVVITITILGIAYHQYPLEPVQLLLLALLNDIPIVSLAYDRVKVAQHPTKIKTNQRFLLSLLFGSVGVVNSILFFLIFTHYGARWDILKSAFFLKLTVSGHMLIYVAHTPERWWKFLPSRTVIIATLATQGIATILALTGTFIPKLSLGIVIFVWGWAFFWMQISELVKWARERIFEKSLF
jgi:H+-transporting ATPase